MAGDPQLQVHPIPLRLSNAYLVRMGERALLVDAGSPGDSNRILNTLQRMGVRSLDWLFLTHAHYDHIGSAAALRRTTGARVLIQEEDLPAMRAGRSELGEVRGRGWLSAWLLPVVERLLPVEPIEPDQVFTDRISVPEMHVEINAIHTPGHTLGSSVLFVDDRYLFAGDLISTNGRPHPQRYYAQDWLALARSLQFIQELNPALTYPGHGRDPLPLAGLRQLKT